MDGPTDLDELFALQELYGAKEMDVQPTIEEVDHTVDSVMDDEVRIIKKPKKVANTFSEVTDNEDCIVVPPPKRAKSSRVNAPVVMSSAAKLFSNLTITGNSWVEVDETLHETVKYLGEKGVSATILNENGNILQPPMSKKGKEKVNDAKRKRDAYEDGCIDNNNNLSNRQIAQRIRRDRERASGMIKSQLAGLTPNRRVLAQRQRFEKSSPVGQIDPSLESSLNEINVQTPNLYEHQLLNGTPLSIANSQIQLQRPNSATIISICPRNIGEEFVEIDVNPMPNTSFSSYISSDQNSMPCTFSASHVNVDQNSMPSTSSLSHFNNDQNSRPSTSYEPHNHEDEEGDGDDEEFLAIPIIDGVGREIEIPEGRHFLGSMNVMCSNCKALHWMDERLTSSSKRNPKFGTCCLSGKVRLPPLKMPPPTIQALYDGNDTYSKSFLRYIREYNAANAFTSLGCKIDQRTFPGRGPKSFIIHGELRHRTGGLVPETGDDPMYSQLYIYDPEAALEVRDRRNPHLKREVLKRIQDTLMQYNAFSHIYRQAFEILSDSDAGDAGQNVTAYLHYSSAKDKRRYNMPSTDEIAIILPGDGSETSGSRDIIVHLKGNTHLKQINECHPAYLPLHYVLLFPHGELGWETSFKQWDIDNDRELDERLTQLQFYCYRIFERPTEYSTILRARKLFQEFIVDAWASTEQNRLTWARYNQPKIRRDLYKGVTEMEEDGVSPDQIGQRYILPSSFTGTPRHMYEIYQDSMAITRFNRHPDIFLTMTANPKWPEIKNALLPHQSPTDRADLVARVFELKRKQLMREVKRNGIFGEQVAHVYTIEFQKRGLPHMHALFFLAHPDKIRSVDQVDNLISAEFPDESEHPRLFETIKRCMIHGPCGQKNLVAPCMENGNCTKKYPRAYAETTTMDRDGYPIYRRRKDGRVFHVNGYVVDNRNVVPYNGKLSEMLDCHINVEVCAGVRAVKYIHKYIYKGHDRTTIVLGGADEIQQYLDARYIGPPEAAWRIFGHHLHEEDPSVTRLHLHLEGMHLVSYNPDESAQAIQERAKKQTSTLIEFLNVCDAYPPAREYTYQEFPQKFVWRNNKWTVRKQGISIGRIYCAGPNSGERFYLRLLLLIVKGPRSFKDLRTVDGILHDTFKSACMARGLLEDDDEWVKCLEEAALMKTGGQLRRLFSIILTQCAPLQPENLWNKFAMNICDDLAHKLRTAFGILEPTESQVIDYGLFLLNQHLQESGKSLADFPPMVQPVGNWSNVSGNRLIWEHRQLQYDGQEIDAQRDVDRLNDGQRVAYSAVIDSVEGDKGTTFFLNGGAGTGKTFVYNTIAAKCRSVGHIVITVASSGIASLLLVGGRTAHSTFKIPIDVLEDSICGFTKQSITAGLLRETKLIIWDEVPMQHRFCVEAVDRTLQDIHDNNRPFGGITVVLGGDFRQTLPVIVRGLRQHVVAASLRCSGLWPKIQVFSLSQNMRLNNGESGNVEFAEFLLEIGSNPEQIVQLPTTMHICQSLSELIFRVYPQLNVIGSTNSDFLTERTILSARNEDVNIINNEALSLFPGENIVYLAADKQNEDEGNDQFPTEYLNTLEPSGLPPFKLELKVGCPAILLRNLAPKDGLCNGTRLMIVQCDSHCIEAEILTGDKAGDTVFIPRISLSPSSSELTISMTRRQFPIRLAFAMTINKAQGQSVKFVGIDLRTPVFSHGQLYVALSRCTSFNRISILLPAEAETNSTTNIVYPEVLLECS